MSTETIIGLDFLEHIQATIDLVNEKIILPNDGGHFKLQRGCNNTDDGACSVTVCAMKTFLVPPSSETSAVTNIRFVRISYGLGQYPDTKINIRYSI